MEEGEIMYSRPVAIKIIKKNPNGSYVIEYIKNKWQILKNFLKTKNSIKKKRCI